VVRYAGQHRHHLRQGSRLHDAATSFADDSQQRPALGVQLVIKQLDNVLVNWNDTRTSKWAPRQFSDGSAGSAEYLAAISADVRKRARRHRPARLGRQDAGQAEATRPAWSSWPTVSEINATQAVLQSWAPASRSSPD
jgi:hypothetical protein